jgi:hypothetical protein
MISRTPTAWLLATAIAGLAACQTSSQVPVARNRDLPASAPSPISTTSAVNQQTFASPDDALKALTDAAQAADRTKLAAIFGPDIQSLASADELEQKAALQRFSQRMSQKSHVEMEPDGSAANIYVGENDYPFPIPLVKDPGGQWFFDTKAGETEILNRCIGRDELDTIDLCHVFVDAEHEYAATDHDNDGIVEYARHLTSSPGKHDGLYWPAQPGEPQSPLGPLAAQAAAQGYPVQAATEQNSGPHPFHGYFFKILTRQGPAAPAGAYNYIINGHMVAGFALLAYPAEYGKSGVMTFMVSRNNVVYQQDLGPNTAAKAKAINAFNPDRNWTPVKDSPVASAQ